MFGVIAALIALGVALRAQNEAKEAKREIKMLRYEMELKDPMYFNKKKKEK